MAATRLDGIAAAIPFAQIVSEALASDTIKSEASTSDTIKAFSGSGCPDQPRGGAMNEVIEVDPAGLYTYVASVVIFVVGVSMFIWMMIEDYWVDREEQNQDVPMQE